MWVFGTGAPEDPERRFGRIPTLRCTSVSNQVRTVVNALIERYGHPSEVIVELARDLKQSREQREEEKQAPGRTTNPQSKVPQRDRRTSQHQ